MTRDEYVSALKSAAIVIGKRSVMRGLVSRFPYVFSSKVLGYFANPLVAFIVEKVLTLAIEYGELGAFFLYTDFRVAKQAANFEKAAMYFQTVKNSKNKEQIKYAENALKKEFSFFVSLKS